MSALATGSFQEVGGLDPLMATGTTVERSRVLLGAGGRATTGFSIRRFSICPAYGKFVDNFSQKFRLGHRQPRPPEHHVQASAKSQYGVDAGASASLSLSNTARALYQTMTANSAPRRSPHQGTVGVELEVVVGPSAALFTAR